MSTEPPPSTLPLLGPGADLVREISQYSTEDLLEIAEQRGIELDPSASHGEIVHRLVRDKLRTSIDEIYQVQDDAPVNIDEYLPYLLGLIAKYRPTRVTELGCGTGKVSVRLRSVLPPDGAYLGSDYSEAGVRRAIDKNEGDPRFSFCVADAVEAPILERSDSIVFTWVMNWLDTHSVESIWRRLAALRPAPILITCVGFRQAVDRRPGVARDDARELDAADRYLRGDRAAAAAIWDTTRYECYLGSMQEHFEILETSIQPAAHIFWAARSRGA